MQVQNTSYPDQRICMIWLKIIYLIIPVVKQTLSDSNHNPVKSLKGDRTDEISAKMQPTTPHWVKLIFEGAFLFL